MYNLILTIVVIASLVCDVSYFMRLWWSYFIGRRLQKRIKITDTVFYYDFSISDMHSDRYLTLLDSARTNFIYRSVIGEKMDQAKSFTVIGAYNAQYIRPIRWLSFYRIETKMLCWDDRRMIFQHKFVTLQDGETQALFQSITHCLGGINMAKAMADIPGADTLMQVPDDIDQWQEVLKTTSTKLRIEKN